MNVDKIMAQLKQDRFWADDAGEAPQLEVCPFCGGEARLIIRHPLYGAAGAAVRCRRCHMRGPNASIYALILKTSGIATPMTHDSLERGIMAAVEAWNSRSGDPARLGALIIREAAV